MIPDGLEFQEPIWLWALLAIPVLAGLGLLAMRGRGAAARAYADPAVMPVPPSGRARRARIGASALALLALGAIVVALARPTVPIEDEAQRSAVMLTLDVSDSMQKTDFPPTRLEAAVAAAREFAEAAPEDTAIGLVTFADGATARLAPTTDRAALSSALDGLGETREGTALGEAIVTSIRALEGYGALTPEPESAETSPARILVLTDGANSIRQATTPEEAAERALAERVPVYSILIGDDPGRPDQPTPEETLAGVAARTGGVYAQSVDAAELDVVFADIGSVVIPVEELRELAVWAVALALVLLVAAAAVLGLALPPRPGSASATASPRSP